MMMMIIMIMIMIMIMMVVVIDDASDCGDSLRWIMNLVYSIDKM